MINGKKILALIPARGGSKGLLGKNLRMLNGKPLLAWSILAAKASHYIDHLILSSDDPAIIEVARHYGCDIPFIRPTHLAQDDTPTSEVVIHALEQLNGFDYIVLLQPTSPLRSSQDIDNCILRCEQGKRTSCVSVVASQESPYWMYFMKDETLLSVINTEKTPLRRQDLPIVYNLNGAIYVSETNAFKQSQSFLNAETTGYCMPRERSVDIDDEFDFKMAEAFLLRENRVYENV